MKSIFVAASAIIAAPAAAQPPREWAAPRAAFSQQLVPAAILAPASKPIERRRNRRALYPQAEHLSAERSVRVANSLATLEPASGAYLDAEQVYPFSDGAIYHVFTAPGQVTDIALQPGERLGAVAAGDTVRWVIGDTSSGSGDAKRTHVLVKPFASGLSSNIIITTDRRTYHLALTSTPRSAMSAVSWVYPMDRLLVLRPAAGESEIARSVAPSVQVGQLHFGYVISGSQPAWRPLRAFDDGRQTFIEFPASLTTGDAPPLFLVDPRGTVNLVNYRVNGRYYVVDRIFDVAELRLGLKHQDIVRITRTDDLPARRKPS